ncbi:hypothetical protein NUW58_g4077 [Xylaria curta]|uniref:Uncharacterized protein n=1 Tax=Xylaria curta TaxID=42375 RepID=A0ACC1PAR7_9PEZI|nr:hypothetical protein NUW58_g4077 [Xylaria curta]
MYRSTAAGDDGTGRISDGYRDRSSVVWAYTNDAVSVTGLIGQPVGLERVAAGTAARGDPERRTIIGVPGDLDHDEVGLLPSEQSTAHRYSALFTSMPTGL